MDKYEKRRQSLIILRDRECAGKAAELARRIGRDASYVSRMLYPEGKPGRKRIADDMKEVIENAFNLPQGWMDTNGLIESGQTAANTEQGPDIKGLYPLISWVKAGQMCGVVDNLHPGDAEEWFPCPVACSKSTFILRVRGISMEPAFRNGELIFVDPEVAPRHGSYIVVRMDDSDEATFKQLVVEGDRRFLKALNPDWPDRIVEINKSATICGVVVFVGRKLV